MRNRKPDMIVFGGDLYIRRDVLVKKIKQSRKVAMESYEDHYDACIQEWLDNGGAFDIREEQKIKKQCSKNIGHAIDALARAIEGIEIYTSRPSNGRRSGRRESKEGNRWS